MKQGFWARDWVAALGFSLAFALLAGPIAPERFEALERRVYDLGVRAHAAVPSPRVAVVAIDRDSIARIGPLPWPETVHARLLDRLREAGVAVATRAVPLSDARDQPGLEALAGVSAFLAQSALTQAVPEQIAAIDQRVAAVDALARRLATQPRGAALPAPDLAPLHELVLAWNDAALAQRYAADLAALQTRVDLARDGLSADEPLRLALERHGASLLPIRFVPARSSGAVPAALPEALRARALEAAPARIAAMPAMAIERLPSARLAAAAAGIGHLGFEPDSDGVVRSESLALRHDAALYPSLSLLTAALALGVRPADIRVQRDGSIALGRVRVPASADLRWRPAFAGGPGARSPFAQHAFADVLDGRVAPEALRDKVVLIGITAPGLDPALATSVTPAMPAVMVLAQAVSGLLQGQAFAQPAGGPVFTLLALAAGAAYLGFAWPRLAPALAWAVTAGLVLLLLLAEFCLLAASALWVRLTAPALLLVLGHLFMTLRAERGADAARPATRAPAAGAGVRTANAPVRATRAAGTAPGGGAPPALGRYEVERELGKGAMGVVYLGRDPKIGRRVAIKTLALSEDFVSADGSTMRERFFREAKAAGNLSHPHIVQIYDAGEERDLAYIAMEFIEGHDLSRHTKPGTLLPVNDVLRYIADAADALDYAHRHHVVHRDIKPANLMLIEQTRTLKVTDFGVARFTDSSRTRTGMVLGTPSYMSPEQLSGRKVDGRSDLFSLGVTAYQLLTGALPFQAASLPALMFKIANEVQAPPTRLRPDLPPVLDTILGRVLQKDSAARHAHGSALAADLRAAGARPG